MESSIDALISKLEQSRLRLNTALDKMAPQAEVYPTWKVKQVLDHITGWDILVANTLRTYLRGETPEQNVKSIDKYNAESVSARDKLSIEKSRAAYEAARLDVIQMLHAMPPDMLEREFKAPWGGQCTIASMVKIFVSHEKEHAKQVEKLLAQGISG